MTKDEAIELVRTKPGGFVPPFPEARSIYMALYEDEPSPMRSTATVWELCVKYANYANVSDQRTARFTPGERKDIAQAIRHHIKSIADASRRNRLDTLASEWEQTNGNII